MSITTFDFNKLPIPYASNTGTRRNLSALRDRNWRILLTPDNPTPPEGFKFAIDNGAWSSYTSGKPFNEDRFLRLVERHAGAADFVVLPDIVAGGMRSLMFSVDWFPRLSHCRHLLLAVQDGMDPKAVGEALRDHAKIGLFLGGTTDWKLKTMFGWGMVAHSMNRWFHIGRVNTKRRIRLAIEAGATSFDGTSASMYSSTVGLLDSATKQTCLLHVRNHTDNALAI